MIAAFRRAYLRQRIRWAEQDVRWLEEDAALLPARTTVARAFLGELRTSLAILERPARRNPRSAWLGPLALLGCALAATAFSARAQVAWRHIADMSDGTVWSYHPSTVSSVDRAYAVQRERPGMEPELYRFQISPTTCAAQQGVARLLSMSGELLAEAPFLLHSAGDSATLARGLCAALRGRMT